MHINKKGILAVIGSSIAIFWPGAFTFGFPGVMGPYWQGIFHRGHGAISNTLLFVYAAVGIFSFLVGRWQEKIGIRRTITIGAAFCGLNTLIVAYASKLHILYLWAFVNGATCCFIYVPALTTVQHWYPKRRGLVSGIVTMVFGLSAAIMSPVFSYMFETIGYVSMNLMVTIIALFVGTIAAQFTDAPKSITLCQSPLYKGEVKPLLEHTSLSVKESLRTKSFWFLWLTTALQGAAGIAMVTLSTAFGMSKGFTMKSAVMILTAFNITNGFSRIIMGYLSDLIGRKLSMSITFLAAGCAYFVLPHVSTLMTSVLLVAIIGFAFGTLFAVSAPLVMDCFGPKHYGPIFGLIFTAFGFISPVLGPSLSGYLLDISEGYFIIIFTYLGGFCLISSILIRWLAPLH
jgi:OFA family oxalate/formate antiporter-like MFS transporter